MSIKSISFYWLWFDFWVGVYYDRRKRIIYIGYLPCLGLKIELAAARDAGEGEGEG
jgi:hypothetical protein